MCSRSFFLVLVFLWNIGEHSPVCSQVNNLLTIEVISSGGIYESAFRIRPEGRYREIKGSPYLEEKWNEGQIWLEGDSLPGVFDIRFNVFGNEMQFIHKKDTFAIGNPLMLDKIVFANRHFEYLAFLHNDNHNMAYFEVLVDGKLRLLARHYVSLKLGREPLTAYHPQNEYDWFVSGSVYYLQSSTQVNPAVIPDRKKSWINMAEDKNDEISVFIKENRLKLHRKQDLISLVEFINTI